MALFAIQLGTVAVETLFQLFWMRFLMIVSSVCPVDKGEPAEDVLVSSQPSCTITR